jgi:hypothetical protein
MPDSKLKSGLRSIVHTTAWKALRENYYPFLATGDSSSISRRLLGRQPEFRSPKTFNQKIQWLKLYWRDDLACRCADKVAVRDYVASHIGHDVLNRIDGVYVEDIPCAAGRVRLQG